MTVDYQRNAVEALANGLRAIEAFETGGRNMTLSQVAQRAGLSRATARRYLHTLCALGYAEHDGKHFRLTPRVLKLGYTFISTAPLPKLAQPILEHVGAATGRPVFLGVLDGLDVVFLAVHVAGSTPRPAPGLVNVGGRLPALTSASGRVLLAARTDAEVERLIRKARLPRRVTLKTKTRSDDLLQEIRRVRMAGYATADKEVDLATRSIAVPVVASTGQVAAAITIVCPAAGESMLRLAEQLLPVLRSASTSLGSML
ncbi:MAG TPA: IclR family transcriptional regulator C-terminal domain-containing protein [Burkholderiales bacterium]